jgi:cyclopropane fatty-acyl-phospholipid synthase-like methyltransferase
MEQIFDESNGIWLVDESNKGYHLFDKKLAKNLALFFDGKTVVDLGCGLGSYKSYFNQQGIFCNGYDGNPNTEQLTNGQCKQLDLSKPAKLDMMYDWVLSLEVGEHIPAEFEDVFINNLHINNSKGIVLSWAIEGQAGTGHVNCRNNSYIIAKMMNLGYRYDKEVSDMLRGDVDLWYFANTIMVFKKNI